MRTRREWRRSTWTRPGATPDAPGTRGAKVTDKERGVSYYVTLDTTTKTGEVRLASVEIVRETIPVGIKGYTMKGGTLRPKGKPGTFLAPYDEGVFRVPVQEIIAQALAALDWEDTHKNEDGVRGIVIGARSLAPPTPEQLRQHLRDGMNPAAIAERYERGQRMVYDWLAAARIAAPDLDWPEVKHRPTKKTTDGK